MTTHAYRRFLVLLLLTFSSCMTPAALPSSKSYLKKMPPERFGGTFAAWVGGTSMKSADWQPLEDQLLIGFDGLIGPDSWPVQPEIGFQFHGDSATIDVLGSPVDIDVTFVDVFLGIGRRFSDGDSPFSFTVGGGFVISYGEVEAELFGLTSTVDDSTTGVYFHAGPAVMLNDTVELGLEGRFVFASDFNFNGVPADANSASLALVLRVIF